MPTARDHERPYGTGPWDVGTRLNAIAGAQTRMSDTQEQIAEGLARMEGELETTQERLAGFEDRVYDRFDQVDDRFDNIDDRFDRIDNTLDRLIQLNLDP